jgi:hypothetical protein
MNDYARHDEAADHDRLLHVYLRDHFAGSSAGLALVRRCGRNNTGTELAEVLAAIEDEIDEDRRSLRAMMSRLGVAPSAFKSALGSMAEVLGRVKSNGRIVRRSPSSTVVELEGLAAGIVTKANLWRSLRAAAPSYDALDVDELDRLEARATSQVERVLAAHDNAARTAFRRLRPSTTAPATAE